MSDAQGGRRALVIPLLFAIGGVLLALGPFIPFGNQYNLFSNMTRDWGDFLYFAGSDQENPFTWSYLGHVLSIGAPIVIGVVLAGYGFIVERTRFRAIAHIAAGAVHALALVAFAFTLWVKYDVSEGDSRSGVYLGGGLLVTALVGVELGLAWFALRLERLSAEWLHAPTLVPLALGGLLVPLAVPDDAPFSPSGLVVTGVGAVLLLAGAFLARRGYGSE